MSHPAVTDNAHLGLIVFWSIALDRLLAGTQAREVLLAESSTVAFQEVTTEETWCGTSPVVLDMSVGLERSSVTSRTDGARGGT